MGQELGVPREQDMMENAVTLGTWEEWEIQMGEGVRRAMGVGTKCELQMDRKPTQQDAANFEPKLCLLCSSFLTARWCSLASASQCCVWSAVSA